MWRIDGVRYYQSVLAILIFVEVSVIIALVGMMTSANIQLISSDFLHTFLVTAVLVTFIMVLNLVIYIVIFQVVSNRSDGIYHQEYHKWSKIWAQAYFTEIIPDDIPVNQAIVEAHLDFTKSVPNRSKMILWAKEHKILDLWYKQVRSRNKIKVLRALEAIGLLGSETDLEMLFKHANSNDLEVNIASTIAIAYLINRLPSSIQDTNIYMLADVLAHSTLPVFVIEEIYRVLELHSQKIKSHLLSNKNLPDNVLLATINAINANYEAHYTDFLGRYIHHENPMIRGAILKLFKALKHIPKGFYRDVLKATQDNDKGVREQALKTLLHLPLFQTRLPLWLALGDQDWWVRHTAADVLKKYGEEGEHVLNTASQNHDTEFGKEIAVEVLATNV